MLPFKQILFPIFAQIRKMKKILLTVIIFLLGKNLIQAQTSPFEIFLEPMNISGLGGLQAFAFGQYDGKWLIVGGRLDGLHRRQPFASFDVAGNNNQLLVIDPTTQQFWTSAIGALSVDLQEQLSSTNMQFHQEGNYLYVLGGYGYHTATASRKTFEFLTAIDVPSTINAIVNSGNISPYFRQISDTTFGVTGGQLRMINNTYYLIGGNRFDGNYNPMGNPTYTQVYTNAIRKFNIIDNGTTISINHLPSHYDAANLRRRDYNAIAQILPNGAEGITAFSGVFQPNVDLPFLNSVTIDSTNYTVNNLFQQHYNHYHCANLPLYGATNQQMHNVFFGGIAQFYDSAGVMVQDNNVPFVKTIARVTRDAAGVLSEHKMGVEMPAYLGAGSEFIPLLNNPHFNNEVFKLDDFVNDTTHVGYIYGGINSSEANIFFTNSGTQSSASSTIFKVYVIKNNAVQIGEIEDHKSQGLQPVIYPNPGHGDFNLQFFLEKATDVTFRVQSLNGTILVEKTIEQMSPGQHVIKSLFQQSLKESVYLMTIKTNQEEITRKIIVE